MAVIAAKTLIRGLDGYRGGMLRVLVLRKVFLFSSYGRCFLRKQNRLADDLLLRFVIVDAVFLCVPSRLSGSPNWTRTSDPMINSHLLYQLSYRGTSSQVLRMILI